jgi:hypothetical protein
MAETQAKVLYLEKRYLYESHPRQGESSPT